MSHKYHFLQAMHSLHLHLPRHHPPPNTDPINSPAAWSSSNLVWVHFVSIVCVLSVIGNGFLLDSVVEATVACRGSLMASMEVMAKEAAATEVNKDAAEC